MRRLFGRRGSITIFLCIFLSAAIVVESIYISGAVRRKREVVLSEAVSHQVEQIMSQFKREYLDWYGIYALQDVASSDAVFSKMTDEMEECSFQYELTDLMDNSDLRDCISDYMRLRGVAFGGEKLLERLGLSLGDLSGNGNFSSKGLSSVLPTFKSYLKNQEKWKSIFETLRNIGGIVGLDDKLEDFFDFVDEVMEAWEENSSATLQIGDTSVVISLFDPSCVGELTSALDAYMDMDLPGIVDRLLMNEYAVNQFDSRIKNTSDSECNMLGIPFSDIHGKDIEDLEYILCGFNKNTLNCMTSAYTILGIRLILDLSAYLMDEAKKELALGIAEILAIVLAVVSGGVVIVDPTMLQYLILFIMAYYCALSDMFKLINGKEVPLFYNKKISDGLGKFSYTTYRDYFRIMLLFVPEDKLLERMRLVIERDCGIFLYTGVIGTGTMGNAKYQVERRYELYEE